MFAILLLKLQLLKYLGSNLQKACVSAHQQYLPRPSRVPLVRVYGDDDYYNVSNKICGGSRGGFVLEYQCI